MERKSIRKRKVYYAYYNDPSSSPHPLICIGGKYLEKYGFEIGDAIEVNFSEHEITIKKLISLPDTSLKENT